MGGGKPLPFSVIVKSIIVIPLVVEQVFGVNEALPTRRAKVVIVIQTILTNGAGIKEILKLYGFSCHREILSWLFDNRSIAGIIQLVKNQMLTDC